MAPGRDEAAGHDARNAIADPNARDDLAALNERYPYVRPTPPRRASSSSSATTGLASARARSLAGEHGGARRGYDVHELQTIPSTAPMADPPKKQRGTAAPSCEEVAEGTEKRPGEDVQLVTSHGTNKASRLFFWRRGGNKRRLRRVSRTERATEQLALLYQRFIVQGLLRRKPLPPTADGRHVPLCPSGVGPEGLVDERSGKPYISNFIRSSRYTLYDFIPKQLIFQFSKIGNFYFLIMAILQMIPGLSTVGRWTTAVPLGLFVAFSMGKEGYDDYRRYKLDKVENRSPASVLACGVRSSGGLKPSGISRKRPGDIEEAALRDLEGGGGGSRPGTGAASWVTVQWQDVRVGDVLRLRRDQAAPADMVLLHATGPNGVAYIETMALDGETNLKSKQTCPLLVERCSTVQGIMSAQATIVSEDPNLDLYSYEGRVAVDDGETLPLSLNNVIFRGSTLRNTSEATGLVVNSGEECKIRMNANKHVRAKKPAMQTIINKMVLFQILVVLGLAGGLTAGYYLWEPSVHATASAFLPSSPVYNGHVTFKEIFVGFILMFNTLIPVSLYISMEIIKIGQFLLMRDVDMYDPVTDTPMVANTTTILENLGQVSYVFSDKTGTMTQNLMRFRKLSVAGVACLHDMDLQRDAAAAKHAKGKGRDVAISSAPMKALPEEDDEDDDMSIKAKPYPARQGSLSSMPHWKSSVRPDDEPEMKTEQLLDYIQRRPNTTFSRKAKHFLLCIALCHTCLPEYKDGGELAFQAASPDELALVEAARDLGFLLIDRPAQSIKLQTRDADGSLHVETYQVLDVVEFSSKRKRMSIVIRMPDGRICVFCKGADNVIMSRLKLSHLAEQKAKDISRRASLRKTFEQDKALRRMSEQGGSAKGTPRTSFAMRRADSSDVREGGGLRLSLGRRSTDLARLAQSDGVASWLNRRRTEELPSPRASTDLPTRSFDHGSWVDESLASNEAAVFERCFQHVDDFASEGLRTLLYAYRYVDEDSYASWKEQYHRAQTSLVDRQMLIEEAGEQIEQRFELAGATAIEDKLQEGVPETIDKLRRANIKIWMITGDKRETAINIGHSARLCKPYSELYILDVAEGNLQESMTTILNEVGRGMVPHSVLVVDGQTLAAIDADNDSLLLFNDLVVRVDSVICCRASPSQKADLIKSIRRHVPDCMTLAIGDGANDIGMIQASHVGIGISGREGLQASRIADYSIAQFRFLQKLLLVHGRWNYLRTGKYVLATFWKEIVFFLVQAHFQRYTGYTGTSLFESWSLTVFNSAFTSLPVILLGIFDRDLAPETLLAVPELYTFGQRNEGFNFAQYFGWMIMGTAESLVIFFTMYGVYARALFTNDTGLFAMGVICFTVAVIFINIKLLVLEVHSKTAVIFGGLIISVGGWFLWNMILSAVYKRQVGPYIVRDSFLRNFGRELQWWTTMLLGLTVLVALELVVQGVRRVYWPTDQDLMQRIEKDKGLRCVMRMHAGGGGADDEGVCDDDDADDDDRSDVSDEEEEYGARGGIEMREGIGSGKGGRVVHRHAGDDDDEGRTRGSYEQQKQQQQQTAPPQRQHVRVSVDEYRPPKWSHPAEERENPFDSSTMPGRAL
ncbi:drs2 neo1 protein [Purpureocillium takamizusanense]|uniref:Phospholipid-transporting ATPase n=1 Tax=Purpureocillium takamizusanense TaxID=2060973 RepID=A0A9Q8VC98_9HYPO|nr:drs2 neo1 protein [Purpureocillium takamizusanense]UNI19607.1 drs2 neo1 protein [Purpureocillium takamizusanense]